MEQKFENLEQLTEALYREAVEKAEGEIKRLKQEAEAEKEEMLKQAEERAENIRRKAQKEAQDLLEQTERELAQRGREVLERLKQELRNKALGAALGQASAEAMQDEAFVRELILQLAGDWKPEGYRLELPSNWQTQWASQLKKNLPELEITAHSDLENRFRLVRKDDHLHFDFDDQSFDDLLRKLLRPLTDQLLFGKNG